MIENMLAASFSGSDKIVVVYSLEPSAEGGEATTLIASVRFDGYEIGDVVIRSGSIIFRFDGTGSATSFTYGGTYSAEGEIRVSTATSESTVAVTIDIPEGSGTATVSNVTVDSGSGEVSASIAVERLNESSDATFSFNGEEPEEITGSYSPGPSLPSGYTITFSANIPSVQGLSATMPPSIRVGVGESVGEKPQNPSLTYTTESVSAEAEFKEWVKADGTSYAFTDAEITESFTLYATWGDLKDATSSTYYVYDESSLRSWADAVDEAGESAGCTLLCDISLSDAEGDTANWGPVPSFSRTFDGGGHTIRNVKINDYISNPHYYSGFFAEISSGGKVLNLNLDDVEITINASNNSARLFIGSIAGGNSGAIEGCSVTNAIIDAEYESQNFLSVGGICGMSGVIKDCSFDGMITGVKKGGTLNVGGICGYNYPGSIIGCDSTGNVTATGENINVGGVCGNNNQGKIISSHSTADVTAEGSSFSVGGVLGKSENGTPQIIGCYSTGYIKATASGGSAADSAYCFVGGVCGGSSNTSIIGCYSTGDITATGIGDSISAEYYVGGVCGSDDSYTGTSPKIIGCYSTVDVKTADNYVAGGVCGEKANATATACYWNSNLANGVGSGDSAGTEKVDGSTVTWIDAVEAMNGALNDVSEYGYLCKYSDGNPPTVTCYDI